MAAPLTMNDIIDREAIRDVIYRYARAVDRNDKQLLESVYWPDAIDERDSFTGSRDEFVAWVLPQLHRVASVAQHLIGNILIRVDGDMAAVESYLHGYMRMRDGDQDIVFGGRYIDRMEKRDQEWRIIHRRLMFDFVRDYPDSATRRTGKYMTESKAAASQDISSVLFGSSLYQ